MGVGIIYVNRVFHYRNNFPYIPYSNKYYMRPHMYQQEVFFRIVPEVYFVKWHICLGERKI